MVEMILSKLIQRLFLPLTAADAVICFGDKDTQTVLVKQDQFKTGFKIDLRSGL